MYSCIVCKDRFDDSLEHIREKHDKAHDEYMKEVEQSNYKKPCICGTFPSWFGNELSYEVRCTNCDLLFDED